MKRMHQPYRIRYRLVSHRLGESSHPTSSNRSFSYITLLSSHACLNPSIAAYIYASPSNPATHATKVHRLGRGLNGLNALGHGRRDLSLRTQKNRYSRHGRNALHGHGGGFHTARQNHVLLSLTLHTDGALRLPPNSNAYFRIDLGSFLITLENLLIVISTRERSTARILFS